MSQSNYDYERIPDDEYNKLKFQLRGQYMAILNAFRCYGLNPIVDQSIEKCVKVAENFGMAVRGKKKPIHILEKVEPRVTDDD